MHEAKYWDTSILVHNPRNMALHTEWNAEWEERRRKYRRKVGLALDAPEWLTWRVTTKPPGPVNREYRKVARNTQRQALQRAIASGLDYDEFFVEGRPSRLDNRRWWY